MEKTPKEMLKAYVDSQKFNSTTEIMDAMKEMFRDVLQQVMESELDAELPRCNLWHDLLADLTYQLR